MILEAMNAVKSYFNRNWRRQDLMSSGPISLHAHEILETVYLTLFGAMLCSTVGSYLHLSWEVGGLYTVLSSVASLLCLCFTSPQSVRKRVSLLMIAAFSFGASVGPFTKYLFGIDQVLVSNLLAVTTIGIGIFCFGALIARERSDIYLGCLLYFYVLVFSCLAINALYIIDSYTAHSMFQVMSVQILFMGYFVVYSQEILYNARLGDIDFVNCTLTVFFHLPGILLHAARVLCLGEKIEERRRHEISSGVENREQNAP